MYSSVYSTGSCSLQLFFNSCVICVYNTVYRTLVVFYCPVLMLLFFYTATCTCTIQYCIEYSLVIHSVACKHVAHFFASYTFISSALDQIENYAESLYTCSVQYIRAVG